MKRAAIACALLMACGGGEAAPPDPRGAPSAAAELPAAPPVDPPVDPPVAAPRMLALGLHFVCVLRGGQVLCAGSAPGSATRGRLAPLSGAPTDVVEIDADDQTLCALRDTGTVWCVRSEEPPFEIPSVDGVVRIRVDMGILIQRADGSLLQVSAYDEHAARPVPAAVEGAAPPRLDATADVFASFGRACALGAHGSVACSSDSDPEVHPYLEGGARAIALDNGWLEVVTAEGTVLTDMLNDERYELHPRPALDGLGALRGLCGIRDGSAVCPTLDERDWRTLPEGRVEGHPFVEVARNFDAVCALDVGQALYCWGAPSGGIVDLPGHEPRTGGVVLDLGDATAVAVGSDHACAIRAGGQVVCWGEGFGARPTPIALPDAAFVATELAATALATCARAVDGRVACWGRQGGGGLFGTEERVLPLTSIAVTDAAQLVGASSAVCARLHAGGVVCWEAVEETRVFPVPTLDGATTIGGGFGFVCGSVGGALRCHSMRDPTYHWGPMPVPPLSTGVIDELAVGGDAACWRHAEAWRCVGHNGVGQLGVRPSRPLTAPVHFPSGVGSLVLAHHRTCGLGAGGTVRCAGVLPDGAARTDEERGTGRLTTITGIEGARAIAIGADVGCALLEGGAVRCWGDGYQGALGDGTSAIVDAPTLIP